MNIKYHTVGTVQQINFKSHYNYLDIDKILVKLFLSNAP